MMTTQSSPARILLKKLSIIPVLVIFTFVFAQRVEAQQIIYEQEKAVSSISEKEIKEYNLLAKKYNNESLENKIIKRDELKILRYLFDKMTFDQKEKAEKFPTNLPPKPKEGKNAPSKKQFKNALENKNYGIWINGKKVNNKVLQNYKNTDFSYYFKSFVYENARNSKLPEEYQVSFYTHKYYQSLKENEFDLWKNNFEKNGVIQEIEEIIPPKKIHNIPKPPKNKNLKQNIPSPKTIEKGNQLKNDVSTFTKPLKKLGQNSFSNKENNTQYQNIYTSKNEIKIFSLSKISKEENTELTKDKNYFLDGKKISFKDLKNIKDENIKNIHITSNLDGRKNMYITSKSRL